MSNLDEYVEKIKYYTYINHMSELEIIRYVYIDLGNRFSFNSEFKPFSNRKKRREIYEKCGNEKELNECMESNIIICKSAAYILEYVLKALGIDIITITEKKTGVDCQHIYNGITLKDGRMFIVDLQDDIYNIQSHFFTKNFGLSYEDECTYVISRFEQEQLDKILGFIDEENYYADDYLYLIKSDIDSIEDFGERVKFLLENIDVYENPNMQFTDRQWHHKDIIEKFFPRKEFNYESNNKRIRMLNCYKDINGTRHYVNCISVQTERGMDIYVYNKKEYKYSQIDLKTFARAVKNGLVLYKCEVPGLKKEVKQLSKDEI